MALKLLLILSVVLQVIATVVAIRLIRATKYNSVWILFIIALLAMTATRIIQFVNILPKRVEELTPAFIAVIWLGLVTSFCITVGVFYGRKLVRYIDRLILQRQLTSKRILSTVLRTEEKERIRFSKELHDGLGPLLSSAKMSLSALSKVDRSDADAEIIRNTGFVIEEAIRSLREISNNLSPHVLKEFGLARGIANFVGKASDMHGVAIAFKTNLRPSDRFDTEVEVILYRVICELVNNSLKHSGCQHCTLTLDYEAPTLTLRYGDDGCGFDPRTVAGVGMGLSNIASRINSLNGTLDITSKRGSGMQAVIVVDLTSKGDAKR